MSARPSLMSKTRNNLFRFLAYVRPYSWMIVVAVIGGVVKFTIPLLGPLLTRYLLDDVFLSDALSTAEKINELTFWTFALIGTFIVFYGPWVYVRHYFAAKASHHAVFDMRCDLYYRILRMSASFFNRNKSGSIVARLISDVELAQSLIGTALTNVWMDAAALGVVLVILFRIDPPTACVALATFPLYLYFFKKLRGVIRQSSREVQEELSILSGQANEKISGSAVVHAFTQEQRESVEFKGQSDTLFKTTMLRAFYNSINATITAVLTSIAPLVVTLYGGWRVIAEQITVGDLVAIGLYLGPLYMPLQRFSELNVVFANAMAALDRIFGVMDEQPEIEDRPRAVELASIRGEITFENVSFSYSEGIPVLEDVSFTARPGERIALVGQSGSGKSTLVTLIPRFYEVDSGRVRVDGHDVRDVTVNSLRRHIAMVLQDPVLFSGSIRDNILYGKPEATEDELLAACRAANALPFIRGLHDGFDTEVGERGNFLSGGQKQRITIARAFLKNPEILILDEPTSALDAESERLIQQALEKLMEGRTTLIIAHRLSTIRDVDTILVMEQGRIVERGSHAQLVGHAGTYKSLHDHQFRETVPA